MCKINFVAFLVKLLLYDNFKHFLTNSNRKVSFLLQIYSIPNTVARKPAPTPGFKLKRGKLIQSSKFIGWKSSRHERASSLQQSCSVGLTLSYLLLNAPLFPVNSSVSMAFQYLGFTKALNEHVYMFIFFAESIQNL